MRADVVVLHVVSAEEMEPKLSGEVELVDAETDNVLEIGVSLDTLAAYRARFAAWLADRQADCSQRGSATCACRPIVRSRAWSSKICVAAAS